MAAFIIILIAFFIFLVLYIGFFLPFKKERDYILREINRATDTDEYIYWKKQLKHLYKGIFIRK